MPTGALDLDFLAGKFSLSGGNIRNAVVYAAFLAAGEGTDVEMRHMIKAVKNEYAKSGKTKTDLPLFCPAGICYVYLAAWTCRRSADRISRYLRFLWYASLTPSTAANSTAAEGQMIHVRCHSIVWKLQPR